MDNSKKIAGVGLVKVREALIDLRDDMPAKPERERHADNLRDLLEEYLPVIQDIRKEKGYSLEEVVTYINHKYLADTPYELSVGSVRGLIGRITAKRKKKRGTGGGGKPNSTANEKMGDAKPISPDVADGNTLEKVCGAGEGGSPVFLDPAAQSVKQSATELEEVKGQSHGASAGAPPRPSGPRQPAGKEKGSARGIPMVERPGAVTGTSASKAKSVGTAGGKTAPVTSSVENFKKKRDEMFKGL